MREAGGRQAPSVQQRSTNDNLRSLIKVVMTRSKHAWIDVLTGYQGPDLGWISFDAFPRQNSANFQTVFLNPRHEVRLTGTALAILPCACTDVKV